MNLPFFLLGGFVCSLSASSMLTVGWEESDLHFATASAFVWKLFCVCVWGGINVYCWLDWLCPGCYDICETELISS